MGMPDSPGTNSPDFADRRVTGEAENVEEIAIGPNGFREPCFPGFRQVHAICCPDEGLIQQASVAELPPNRVADANRLVRIARCRECHQLMRVTDWQRLEQESVQNGENRGRC